MLVQLLLEKIFFFNFAISMVNTNNDYYLINYFLFSPNSYLLLRNLISRFYSLKEIYKCDLKQP